VAGTSLVKLAQHAHSLDQRISRSTLNIEGQQRTNQLAYRTCIIGHAIPGLGGLAREARLL
jgi:hypothetical protein